MKKLITSAFLLISLFAFTQVQPSAYQHKDIADTSLKSELPCDSILQKSSDTIAALQQVISDLSKKQSEVMHNILGDLTVSDYISGYFFAFLAIIFMWLILAKFGQKNSTTTPNHWSWKEFFSIDNVITRIRTFLIAILTIYVVFRFSPIIAQSEFSMYFAFGVGLSLDFFTDKIAGLRKKQ